MKTTVKIAANPGGKGITPQSVPVLKTPREQCFADSPEGENPVDIKSIVAGTGQMLLNDGSETIPVKTGI